MSELEDLLAPMRDRAEKATEGPFEVVVSPSYARIAVVNRMTDSGISVNLMLVGDYMTPVLYLPDAELLAHARADQLRLLSALDSVLALHYEDLFRGHLSNGCKTCGHDWPCPTVAAITNTLKEI